MTAMTIKKAATVNFKSKLSFSCLSSHQQTPDVTFSLLNNTNMLFWTCNFTLMFNNYAEKENAL